MAEHPEWANELRAYLKIMQLADRLVDGPAAGPDIGRHPRDGEVVPALLESATLSRWEFGAGTSPRVVLRGLPEGQEPTARRRPTELTGEFSDLGRYRLEGEIGRGGMGAILRCHDVDLGRDLAIKVLLTSRRPDAEAVRRFVEEAQIGGQLQHPGIVPVYDLGALPDRRPYIAMKLVQGRTLSSLLEERPHPAQDLPRFLSIFESISQTVAYAHARGVIHRDMKPSNVMVGAFGEVQVMDWGLAKVLHARDIDAEGRATGSSESPVRTVRSGEGSSEPSEAGSVLGTPAYMAPEQARGEIERLDERTDVFGLGAILCEILTGRRPYGGQTPSELRAAAARGDLAGAYERLDSCGADEELRALALACLAADPSDRPRDAGSVARRITSYRAGVQDRLRAAELARVEAQARAREERKRRKPSLALATSIVLLVAVMGLGAIASQRRAEEDSRRVAVAFGEASRLLESARDSWAHRLDASGYDRAVRAADALESQLSGPLPADLARQARAFADATRAESAAVAVDRTLLGELTSVRTATLDVGLSATDRAYAEAFRRAGLDLDGPDPGGAIARLAARPRAVAAGLAAYLDAWAGLRLGLRHQPEGYLRPLRAAHAAAPSPYRDRLRALLEAPGLASRRDELAKLVNDAKSTKLQAPDAVLLATVLAAFDSVEAAVDVLRCAVVDHPDDLWVNFDLATYLEQLRPPAREEALRYYTAARALRPESAHLLGHLLERMGRGAEARAIFLDLIDRQPNAVAYMLCYAELDRVGPTAGSRMLERALAAARAAAARDPGEPTVHFYLGNLLGLRGELPGAIAAYREAIRLAPDHADARFNLGAALHSSGDRAGALAAYREAVRLDPDFALAHNNLGNVLRDSGDAAGATAEYREAIRIAPDLAGAHNNLANVLRDSGDAAGALAEYREAIRLDPDLAEVHTNLGSLLDAQGRPAEALEESRRGQEMASKRNGRAYPSADRLYPSDRVGTLAERLRGVLQGDGRSSDAVAKLERAMDAYRAGRYTAAARLFAEGMAPRPGLGDDRRAQYRYHAACSAALAAAGRGEDAPRLDPDARAELRRRALGWLEAEWAAWARVLESGPPAARRDAATTLRHWQSDPDLASVRDESALAKLADGERGAWRALWAEVAALLGRAPKIANP